MDYKISIKPTDEQELTDEHLISPKSDLKQQPEREPDQRSATWKRKSVVNVTEERQSWIHNCSCQRRFKITILLLLNWQTAIYHCSGLSTIYVPKPHHFSSLHLLWRSWSVCKISCNLCLDILKLSSHKTPSNRANVLDSRSIVWIAPIVGWVLNRICSNVTRLRLTFNNLLCMKFRRSS